MLGRQVKNMKEVDARGLSCPEPLMLTAEALKNANGPIKVLVSEPHQKTNIEKFAKDKGKKATSTEKGSEFEIVNNEKKRVKAGHHIPHNSGCDGDGKRM